jgi:hypothetical protein
MSHVNSEEKRRSARATRAEKRGVAVEKLSGFRRVAPAHRFEQPFACVQAPVS